VTMLEQAEFEVYSAAEGSEALDLVKENLELIDCAVIDLTMPGMNGREVAGAIHELRPQLPIVLMSGYAPSNDSIDPLIGFLQKPFTADALVDSVRSALNNK